MTFGAAGDVSISRTLDAGLLLNTNFIVTGMACVEDMSSVAVRKTLIVTIMIGAISSANIYNGPAVIQVSMNGPISSLAAAWTLVANKLLSAPITIQFAPGTYPTPNIAFSHPTPHFVTIQVFEDLLP